jgi:glycine hydroxymethyltransferase
MLLSTAEHAKAIDKAVFPGLQGGPHNHTTAAIAVALHEASQPSFKDYAANIVANAQSLGESLGERGFDLVSGGTDNHLLLVDLTNKGVTGKVAAKALDAAGIELNFNTVPFDPRRPFDPSGLRIGAAAITTRGLGVEHMPQVAAWIAEAVAVAARAGSLDGLTDPQIADELSRISLQIRELLSGFAMPGWAPQY